MKYQNLSNIVDKLNTHICQVINPGTSSFGNMAMLVLCMENKDDFLRLKICCSLMKIC